MFKTGWRAPQTLALSALVLGLVVAALALHAPPAVASSAAADGICGRTAAVRDAILAEIDDATDCSEVTAVHLASVKPRLTLNNKGIASLQAGDFAGLSALKSLWLHDNQLTSLPDGVFADLTNLRKLGLSNNRLAALTGSEFASLHKLESLWLHGNDLTELPKSVFSGLGNLLKLNLNGNGLSELPADVFSDLAKLEQLWLRGNAISELPPTVFHALHNLRDIDLGSNEIDSLPEGLFDGNAGLEQIWLNNNGISTWHPDVFVNLYSLTLLDLSGGRPSKPLPPPPPFPKLPQIVPPPPAEGDAQDQEDRAGPSGASGESQCAGFSVATEVLTPERFADSEEIVVDHVPTSGVCWARTHFRKIEAPAAESSCTVTLTPVAHVGGGMTIQQKLRGACDWIEIIDILSPVGGGYAPPARGPTGSASQSGSLRSGSNRVTAESVGIDPFNLTMFWSATTLQWHYSGRSVSRGSAIADAEGYNPLSTKRLALVPVSIEGDWETRWRDGNYAGRAFPVTIPNFRNLYYWTYNRDLMWSPGLGLKVRFDLLVTPVPTARPQALIVRLREVDFLSQTLVFGWYNGAHSCVNLSRPGHTTNAWEMYFDLLLPGGGSVRGLLNQFPGLEEALEILELDYRQNCWMKGGPNDGRPSQVNDNRDDPPLASSRYRWGWWTRDNVGRGP